MTEHDTTRISEYLDGGLTPEERAELEAHLAGCTTCARTLEELRAVVTAADRLPQLPPERDLWPGIEDRLTPREAPGADAGSVIPIHRRRVAVTVPQLIAAAVALVLFSASAVWLAVGGAGDPGPSGPVAGAAPEARVSTVAFTGADQAIAVLEEEYRSRRDALDPETIQVVEKNLAIIDQAIAEARAALADDPSSEYLSTHLAVAMRQKMDLLRRAATIAQTET